MRNSKVAAGVALLLVLCAAGGLCQNPVVYDGLSFELWGGWSVEQVPYGPSGGCIIRAIHSEIPGILAVFPSSPLEGISLEKALLTRGGQFLKGRTVLKKSPDAPRRARTESGIPYASQDVVSQGSEGDVIHSRLLLFDVGGRGQLILLQAQDQDSFTRLAGAVQPSLETMKRVGEEPRPHDDPPLPR